MFREEEGQTVTEAALHPTHCPGGLHISAIYSELAPHCLKE